jgi:hypothetical protein
MITKTLPLALLMLALAGCKTTYYKTWEKLGWEKRDILVDRVDDAKTSQEKAKEQFKTTLERFQELTNFQGGELETKYKKLSTEYDRCKGRADAVSSNINSVDSVAKDMFREWKAELSQYQNAELRRNSEQKLRDARSRYEQLIELMRRSEAKMQPVLTAFHDQVLFLKHNLNAQAIASLQNTAAGIETDVQALIKDMEASINEANEFIKQMKS